MPEQSTITAEQLEQAIQQVIKAVDWSEPPKSDTLSGGERRRSNDHAMAVVFACARKAMQQATPTDQADIEPVPLEAVSANGDGADG